MRMYTDAPGAAAAILSSSAAESAAKRSTPCVRAVAMCDAGFTVLL
jgi:hypothetical protein